MRYLAGTDTGLWVALILGAVFVAYTWVTSRLVGRGRRAEVREIASEVGRRAA